MASHNLFERDINPVLFEEKSYTRKVTLNRPQKLNSLTYEMISQIGAALRVYEDDSKIKFVIFKGKGKAFCAGGDVVRVVQYSIAGHWSFAAKFYQKQLCLDYLLATYKKPLVYLINGIIMGGGAGLSMFGTFRIVTEHTVFAMPEASIGLFPDVGATCFLSRLPGYFGEYLGLTGARINGIEMLACGLATHFVLSKDLQPLEDALCELVAADTLTISKLVSKFIYKGHAKQDSFHKRVEIINKCFSRKTVEEILSSLVNALCELVAADTLTISKLVSKFIYKGHAKQDSFNKRVEIINKCFSRKTVEEILSSLEEEMETGTDKWIVEAISSLKSASPTSLKITLRSIREGRLLKLEHCLSREFTLFRHFMRRTVNNDFYEGARAMLIDKDKKSKWEPPQLWQVSEEMVDRFFAEAEDDDEWEDLHLPNRSGLSNQMKPKL
ncbi:putative 3-hydroxyisobutyryl-CoA hydrolase 3 [Camellia lanceoleosa]|uniref:3-hydroxyisobutyryl-CoA hydrolase 3 n=1 Tax=Camellia lanceoleosa TaxID=1840588 RepID=A0ACC0IIX1_9ERIC|nr:putative 3-hydroxyisobutyryl-CoA hydrolase 3 [Camellia lanceoleosa]